MKNKTKKRIFIFRISFLAFVIAMIIAGRILHSAYLECVGVCGNLIVLAMSVESLIFSLENERKQKCEDGNQQSAGGNQNRNE